jgi:hypothetical protein
MITTDCPICTDTAIVDDSLDALTCDACGLVAPIAPDPSVPALDLAA